MDVLGFSKNYQMENVVDDNRYLLKNPEFISYVRSKKSDYPLQKYATIASCVYVRSIIANKKIICRKFHDKSLSNSIIIYITIINNKNIKYYINKSKMFPDNICILKLFVYPSLLLNIFEKYPAV